LWHSWAAIWQADRLPYNSSVTTILAIETSCDETAVAILRDGNGRSGPELLASEVASQIAEHDRFGGVVPEVASRNHLVHAPRSLERATRAAKIDITNVDAFAATSGPGLASSLMIGASIAKGLAIGYGKPYLAINHLEGHLLSPFFVASASSRSSTTHRQDADARIPRHISLIVSGGHTMSVCVRDLGDYEIVGRTVDDAAGEAFDKVAKLLGLGYPGGPEIEKHARDGNPRRFDLPRSMLDSDNFSFSGLKTAVRYLLPKLKGNYLADLCASFQQSIVDVLVRKTINAARKCHVDLVAISGGVSCNRELRRQMRQACAEESFVFKSAAAWLCTDNAAMIAFGATLRLQRGLQSSVTEEIDPNLALA
jgi:N6-L-threonylcarbamoyladenine synthase